MAQDDTMTDKLKAEAEKAAAKAHAAGDAAHEKIDDGEAKMKAKAEAQKHSDG